MKKIITSLVVFGFLFSFLVPALVSAQGTTCTINNGIEEDVNRILGSAGCTPNCPPGDVNFEEDFDCGVNGASCCLFASIINITRWIFMLLMVIVVLLIIFGAFSITTSSGDAEKVKKGRDSIIYALVGLAAALLAYALPWLMRSMIGI